MNRKITGVLALGIAFFMSLSSASATEMLKSEKTTRVSNALVQSEMNDSNEFTTTEVEFNDFNELEINGLLDVRYHHTRGDFRIVIKGTEKAIKKLHYSQIKNKLSLKIKKFVNIGKNSILTVDIYGEELVDLELNNVNTYSADSPNKKVPEFEFESNGRGGIRFAEIKANEVSIDLSGVTKLYVDEIKANEIDVEQSGMSKLTMPMINCKGTFDIEMTGADSASLNFKYAKRLVVEASGIPSLCLSGKVDSANIDDSLLGKVDMKNLNFR